MAFLKLCEKNPFYCKEKKILFSVKKKILWLNVSSSIKSIATNVITACALEKLGFIK